MKKRLVAVCAVAALGMTVTASLDGVQDASAQQLKPHKQKIVGPAKAKPQARRVTKSNKSQLRVSMLSGANALNNLAIGGTYSLDLSSKSCTLRLRQSSTQRNDRIKLNEVGTVSMTGNGTRLRCKSGKCATISNELISSQKKNSLVFQAKESSKRPQLKRQLKKLVQQCYQYTGKRAPSLEGQKA